MSLLRLDISKFRNLSAVKLNLLPRGINFFYGKNGSGKTSLIEAVHYLLCGRSFRTTNINHLIQHQSDKLNLFAEINLSNQCVIPAGIERARSSQAKIKIGGKDSTSLAELARLTPALLLHTGSHQLLDAGPIFRRKYLDWGAFYLYPDYLQKWKLYARALRQRNSLLRNKNYGEELTGWTAAVIKYGSDLHEMREKFIEQLLPILITLVSQLLVIPELQIIYAPGWKSDLSLAEAVEKSRASDIAFGCSQVGPHRADFNIKINQITARDILSRGQQKLFVCAMLLAQGLLIKQCQEVDPIYLVDDLPAELDQKNRAKLMALILEQNTQIFLTAIDSTVIKDIEVRADLRMFHVEHGEVVELQSQLESTRGIC